MEQNYWKEIALYLADCHAATAYYELSKRSTSKSERERQISLCKLAHESIKNGYIAGKRISSEENVLERLNNIIETFEHPAVTFTRK